MSFALRRAAALFFALEAAKLAVCGLRSFDGCTVHVLRALAAGIEEVAVAFGFFVLLAFLRPLAARFGLGSSLRRAATVTTLALATWAALNVPGSRLVGTPLTWRMMTTAGGALRDSIARYVTASNLGAIVVVIAIALCAPLLVRSRRVFASAASLAVAVLVASVIRGERDPLALDRDPTLVLVRTAFATPNRAAWDAQAEVAAEADPTTDGFDLGGLRGAARGRHVVWVILESTGARYLSTYGARHDPMPNLARLARQGIVFEQAFAVYPESIKGLYAMLCSFAPAPGTSARDYAASRLPCTSIVETMRREGLRTSLHHSGRFDYLDMDVVVKDRGIEELADAKTIGGRFASSFGTDDMSTARAVLARFDRRAPGERIFATYMPISGHHPYETPGEGPRPFGEKTDEDRYRSDLFRGDNALGALVEGLSARGVWNDTLLVVHGDHGEAFFQHEGNFAHTLHPYDENLHVPLVVVAPGIVGREIRAKQLVSLLDIAPTIAELSGAPIDPRWQGRSALDPSPRVVRAFTDQAGERLAVRTGRFKLVLDRDRDRTSLFDLAIDPDERRPVLDPVRTARLRADVEGWSARQGALVIGAGKRADVR